MPDPMTTLRRIQNADRRWQAAIDDSVFAPPDPAFADRVRAIAAAAAGEAVVLQEAAHTPKLRWKPAQNNAIGLSYELRPGANRPGPPESWEQFDAAVQAVSDAQFGTDFAAIANAFDQLGAVALRLAGEIDAERQQTTTQALRDAS